MCNNPFKITYLFHSGFLVECSRCYYLFDYYRGALPTLKPDKPILVFASHNHPDHYNPKIFEILARENMTQVSAIFPKELSKKIASKRGNSKMAPPENVTVNTVTFHKQYELPCDTRLDTFQSTDIGVAFCLTCPDGILYHGGDLNDWVRSEQTEQYNKQMTGSYRHEINLLAASLESAAANTIDAAFLPLDPLLKENYSRGMLYFLKKIPVRKVYPMHYWGEPEIIEKFLQEYPEYQEIVQHTESFASST